MTRVLIAGMTKTAAKESVAPRKRTAGEAALPGTADYEILNWSLNARDDRDWYPDEAPDWFEVRAIKTEWRGLELNWFPVFGGEAYPWSYAKGFSATAAALVKSAARREIAPQICAVARKGMHVHHDGRTFADLFGAWLSAEGLTVDAVEVFDNGDLGGLRFSSGVLSRSWRDYHDSNATLKLLTPDEHKAAHKGAPA